MGEAGGKGSSPKHLDAFIISKQPNPTEKNPSANVGGRKRSATRRAAAWAANTSAPGQWREESTRCRIRAMTLMPSTRRPVYRVQAWVSPSHAQVRPKSRPNNAEITTGHAQARPHDHHPIHDQLTHFFATVPERALRRDGVRAVDGGGLRGTPASTSVKYPPVPMASTLTFQMASAGTNTHRVSPVPSPSCPR